jgi:hypothetical protein
MSYLHVFRYWYSGILPTSNPIDNTSLGALIRRETGGDKKVLQEPHLLVI